jgi:hypothetical protein
MGKRIFKAVNSHLAGSGITIGRGTIVDATIIHALTSTKNKAEERDPEMHSTKMGNQWHFGMKRTSGSTARADWSIRSYPRRQTSTIVSRWPSSCMETKRAYGATPLIWGKRPLRAVLTGSRRAR